MEVPNDPTTTDSTSLDVILDQMEVSTYPDIGSLDIVTACSEDLVLGGEVEIRAAVEVRKPSDSLKPDAESSENIAAGNGSMDDLILQGGAEGEEDRIDEAIGMEIEVPRKSSSSSDLQSPKEQDQLSPDPDNHGERAEVTVESNTAGEEVTQNNVAESLKEEDSVRERGGQRERRRLYIPPVTEWRDMLDSQDVIREFAKNKEEEEGESRAEVGSEADRGGNGAEVGSEADRGGNGAEVRSEADRGGNGAEVGSEADEGGNGAENGSEADVAAAGDKQGGGTEEPAEESGGEGTSKDEMSRIDTEESEVATEDDEDKSSHEREATEEGAQDGSGYEKEADEILEVVEMERDDEELCSQPPAIQDTGEPDLQLFLPPHDSLYRQASLSSRAPTTASVSRDLEVAEHFLEVEDDLLVEAKWVPPPVAGPRKPVTREDLSTTHTPVRSTRNKSVAQPVPELATTAPRELVTTAPLDTAPRELVTTAPVATAPRELVTTAPVATAPRELVPTRTDGTHSDSSLLSHESKLEEEEGREQQVVTLSSPTTSQDNAAGNEPQIKEQLDTSLLEKFHAFVLSLPLKEKRIRTQEELQDEFLSPLPLFDSVVPTSSCEALHSLVDSLPHPSVTITRTAPAASSRPIRSDALRPKRKRRYPRTGAATIAMPPSSQPRTDEDHQPSSQDKEVTEHECPPHIQKIIHSFWFRHTLNLAHSENHLRD